MDRSVSPLVALAAALLSGCGRLPVPAIPGVTVPRHPHSVRVAPTAGPPRPMPSSDPRFKRALQLWHVEGKRREAARLLEEVRSEYRKKFGIEELQPLMQRMMLDRELKDEPHEYEMLKTILYLRPNWPFSQSGNPDWLRRYAELSEKRGKPGEATEAHQALFNGYECADSSVLPCLDEGIDSPRRLKARALAARINPFKPAGLRLLRQAVQTDPGDPVVAYHLASALELRFLPEAKQAYERVLKKAPSPELADMAKRKIRSLSKDSEEKP